MLFIDAFFSSALIHTIFLLIHSLAFIVRMLALFYVNSGSLLRICNKRHNLHSFFNLFTSHLSEVGAKTHEKEN